MEGAIDEERIHTRALLHKQVFDLEAEDAPEDGSGEEGEERRRMVEQRGRQNEEITRGPGMAQRGWGVASFACRLHLWHYRIPGGNLQPPNWE